MRSGGDNPSPEGRKETGLVLSVVILKVCHLDAGMGTLEIFGWYLDAANRPGISLPRTEAALRTR